MKLNLKINLLNRLTTTLVVAIFLSTSSFAQSETKTTRVLFIFDASQSMHASFGNKTRMDVAKNLLIDMLDKLFPFETYQIYLINLCLLQKYKVAINY